MALIKCPECGREISDRAPSCPGCGITKEDIQKMLNEEHDNLFKDPMLRDNLLGNADDDQTNVKTTERPDTYDGKASNGTTCQVCGIKYNKDDFKECPMCAINNIVLNITKLSSMDYKALDIENYKCKNNVGRSVAYKKGDIIKMGHVENTDIEWVVLKVEKDRVLLISRKILECREFCGLTWEKSILRQYLNSEFVNKYFNQSEQKNILRAKVVNKNNQVYGTSGGNDVDDRVFLLSIDEAHEYFSNDVDRIAIQNEGAKDVTTGVCWWLRSPGVFEFTVSVVTETGNIDDMGQMSREEGIGVRPALWLKVK